MKRIFILLIALFTYISVPNTTYAFQLERLIDPFCLFACEDETQNVINNSTTNVNSNVNSPGATITNVNSNNTPGTTAGTVWVNNDNTPSYGNYNNQQSVTPLSVSCYSNPTLGGYDTIFYWKSSISGGNGNYYATWSGSEGLSGSGTSISKRYNNSGAKNASITVTSGNQTTTRNCNSVEVLDNQSNRYYESDYRYDDYNRRTRWTNNDSYYTNTYYTSGPLYVSCYANTTFAPVGTNVAWQATASGGNGSYSYSWSGSDGLRGYNQYLNTSYTGSGVKTAMVTVYSGNQVLTQSCSNSVTIGVPTYYNGYNYINNNQAPVLNNGFQIACYPDKTSAKVGVPVTWSVEAVAPNGVANNSLSYIWYGTDNLSGNQTSAMTTYYSAGTKTANVTVIAPNGQRATQICGNSVYITKNIAVVAKTTKNTDTIKADTADIKVSTDTTKSNGTTLFSLANIPWGFVAIMVIIILLFMVFYLSINKNKI